MRYVVWAIAMIKIYAKDDGISAKVLETDGRCLLLIFRWFRGSFGDAEVKWYEGERV